MTDTFNDKTNVKGLLKLMDSQKITKQPQLEAQFMNTDKIQPYNNACQDVQKLLQDLDDLHMSDGDDTADIPDSQHILNSVYSA